MPLPPYTPPPPGGAPHHAIRTAQPGQEICDFCSHPEVKWAYPARPHVGLVTETPGHRIIGQSPDDWAACDECHALIERTDREGLLKRSVEAMLTVMKALPAFVAIRSEVETQVRQIHDQFWAHREGAPVPHVKGQA